MPLLVSILIAGFALGIGLVAFGRRGRRLDDHPVCMRCGFDLVGLPPESQLCSECGTEVRKGSGVRIGNRRRRWGAIWGGVALMVICGALLVAADWVIAQQDLQPYKPVWWLSREARSADPEVRKRAIAEVRSRLSSGKLSASQIAGLVETSLQLQADLSKPYPEPWGDFVEAAWRLNRVADGQWQRYLRQSAQISVEFRPRVRRGDPLPARIRLTPRAGSAGSRPIWLEWRFDEVRVGDVRLSSLVPYQHGDESDTWGEYWRPVELDRLPDGPATLHATVQLRVHVGDTRGFTGPIVAAIERTVEAPFTLQPADKPTVRVVHDEGYRAGVEASLQLEPPPRIQAYSEYVSLKFNVGNPAIDLAYRVIARSNQREWSIGTLSCGQRWNNSSKTAIIPGGFSADKADVILRPSPEDAAGTINVFEIWGGEIVFKDLPVDRE